MPKWRNYITTLEFFFIYIPNIHVFIFTYITSKPLNDIKNMTNSNLSKMKYRYVLMSFRHYGII